MKLIVIILVLFVGGAAVLLLVPGWLDRLDIKVELPRMGKRYSRVLVEDAVINRHGVYGVDFVRCRRCSVEKLRQGPLTFGGLGVLVLDGLDVVLPPSSNDEKTGESSVRPQEITDRLGVNDGFLKAQGASLKFSGLRVKDLTVSLLRGTNVVRAFSAASGEAKQDGLHLKDCDIAYGDTNRVPRAVLKVKPALRLEWAGNIWDLK